MGRANRRALVIVGALPPAPRGAARPRGEGAPTGRGGGANRRALVIVGAMRPAPAASISRGRSTHLDVLRAIAALMVIGYHANGLVPDSTGGGGLWLRYNLDSGVELFFVLSGYLIARPFLRALVGGESAPETQSYALRRAARILPGYWLALSVAAFVAARQPGPVAAGGALLPPPSVL